MLSLLSNMSNNFTGIVNDSTNRNITASSVVAANYMNVYNLNGLRTLNLQFPKKLYQINLYTSSEYGGSPSLNYDWLYTIPDYTPMTTGILVGSSDPYFFSFPLGSCIVGFAAMNGNHSVQNTSNITVSTGIFTNGIPSPLGNVLTLATAANLNLPFGVSVGSLGYVSTRCGTIVTGAGSSLSNIQNNTLVGPIGLYVQNATVTLAKESIGFILSYYS